MVRERSNPPSPEHPLTGACLCGGVRFQITAPLFMARYCHCTHCQRRTGTASSAQARVERGALSVTAGRELLRSFTPEGGRPKVFCSRCGSSVFSGDLDGDEPVGVRFGVLDEDPGVRPAARAYVRSAAPWEPLPEDGLPRYEGPQPAPDAHA